MYANSTTLLIGSRSTLLKLHLIAGRAFRIFGMKSCVRESSDRQRDDSLRYRSLMIVTSESFEGRHITQRDPVARESCGSKIRGSGGGPYEPPMSATRTHFRRDSPGIIDHELSRAALSGDVQSSAGATPGTHFSRYFPLRYLLTVEQSRDALVTTG